MKNLNRRNFIGILTIPFVSVFSANKKIIYDSGYNVGHSRLKIYSDNTFENQTWLGVGKIQYGTFQDGKMKVLYSKYNNKHFK